MPADLAWPTRNWQRLIDSAREHASPLPDAQSRSDDSCSEAPSRAPRHRDDDRPTRGQGNAEEWIGSERHGLRPADDTRSAVQRIRLVYQTVDRARFLGNRELAIAFARASRRAGLPLAFSSGHHPMPRMSFGPALSLGFASHGEYLDLDLTEVWNAHDVRHALNGELPEGLVVVEADTVDLRAPSIDVALRAFVYSVSLQRLSAERLPDDAIASRVAAFEAADSYPVTKRIKGRDRTIDARASVLVRSAGPRLLHVRTAVTRQGTLKPHAIVGMILGLDDLEVALLSVTKIGTIVDDAMLPTPVATGVDAVAP
jgi:radical SAM-linked protein